MLRLENIPPEQMPEVVRIASELYTRDQEKEAEAQERQATVAAAEEIGLSEDYLHRAAAELHGRRIAEARERRQRLNGLLALGSAVVVIGTGAAILSRTPALTPPTATPQAAVQMVQPGVPLTLSPTAWQLHTNLGTAATVDFVHGAAVLHVQRFVADASSHFTANLNMLEGAQDLTDLKTVSFKMHGSLPHLRLFLENGNERWRSPLLTVEGQERLAHLDLRQFERQTRADANAPWQKADYHPPTWIQDLSFKTGWYVNDPGASGDVTLSDVRFE
jgi:hypothetical protein